MGWRLLDRIPCRHSCELSPALGKTLLALTQVQVSMLWVLRPSAQPEGSPTSRLSSFLVEQRAIQVSAKLGKKVMKY